MKFASDQRRGRVTAKARRSRRDAKGERVISYWLLVIWEEWEIFAAKRHRGAQMDEEEGG